MGNAGLKQCEFFDISDDGGEDDFDQWLAPRPRGRKKVRWADWRLLEEATEKTFGKDKGYTDSNRGPESVHGPDKSSGEDILIGEAVQGLIDKACAGEGCEEASKAVAAGIMKEIFGFGSKFG